MATILNILTIVAVLVTALSSTYFIILYKKKYVAERAIIDYQVKIMSLHKGKTSNQYSIHEITIVEPMMELEDSHQIRLSRKVVESRRKTKSFELRSDNIKNDDMFSSSDFATLIAN